jgi:hypothetical protein
MTTPSRPKLHLKFAPKAEVRTAIAGYAPPPAPPAKTAATPKPRRPSDIWLDRVIARLEALRQAWPAALRPCDDPGPWPPLAINIHKAIRQRDPALGRPYALLRAALARYVCDHRYRSGRIAGAVRIDLDGQPAGSCSGGTPLRRERRGAILDQVKASVTTIKKKGAAP